MEAIFNCGNFLLKKFLIFKLNKLWKSI